MWGPNEDTARSGTLTSLSERGCFVKTKGFVSEGQRIFVKLWLPTWRWLTLEGAVRYHMERVGFGLVFADVPEAAREIIELLIETHQAK